MKITADIERDMRQMRASGLTVERVAEECDCDPWTVVYHTNDEFRDRCRERFRQYHRRKRAE